MSYQALGYGMGDALDVSTVEGCIAGGGSWHYIKGKCYTSSSCAAEGGHWSDLTGCSWCSAGETYDPVDGLCVSCPTGQRWDVNKGACVASTTTQRRPPPTRPPPTTPTPTQPPKEEENGAEVAGPGFQYWWLVGAGVLLAGAGGLYLYKRRA